MPSSATTLSREHVVFEPAPGTVVVTGGKYPTYRVMAADAVDAAATALAMERMDGEAIPESTTASIALVGADGYAAMWSSRRRLARERGLPEAVVAHLLRRHGDRATDVLDLVAQDPSLGRPLHPSSRHIGAEVLIAVTHEGARSLQDIMLRRLRIGLELPDGGAGIIDDVASLAAPALGWDAADVTRATAEYRAWITAGQGWKEAGHGHDRA